MIIYVAESTDIEFYSCPNRYRSLNTHLIELIILQFDFVHWPSIVKLYILQIHPSLQLLHMSSFMALANVVHLQRLSLSLLRYSSSYIWSFDFFMQPSSISINLSSRVANLPTLDQCSKANSITTLVLLILYSFRCLTASFSNLRGPQAIRHATLVTPSKPSAQSHQAMSSLSSLCILANATQSNTYVKCRIEEHTRDGVNSTQF